MNQKFNLRRVAAALCFLVITSSGFAQGTAFTYQGRLNAGGNAASGLFDLRFAIYDAASGGTQQGNLFTNAATAVSNGLFGVTLDFGDQFPGADRFLEIAVRTNGAASFDVLSPRQPLAPVPYAILAEKAYNVPGLVVQPNTNGAPNIIQGSPANTVSNGVIGATISGGGVTNTFGSKIPNIVTASFGTVGGGLGNTASSEEATVSGGNGNTASGLYATVGGGTVNTASGGDATIAGGWGNIASGTQDATVGGGYSNTANKDGATIGGGLLNLASGSDATVGGGMANTASGNAATVSGGSGNIASGNGSFAAGINARATHNNSFVWNGSPGTFFSTSTNEFSVNAVGGARFYTGDWGLRLGSGGQYFAPGGADNVRFLRGVVDGTGNVIRGSGFTVTRTGVGAYTVTFTSVFGDFPTVTVSAQAGVPRMATVTNVGTSSAQVRTFDGTGAAIDAQFHFIAMGAQ